jgi:hypothetical protein
LSNADIGDIMGRSEGAIKSLYHRTLISLRDDLVETARRKKSDSRLRAEQESQLQWLFRRKSNSTEE